jgi:type IV secretion system protein VirB4
MSTSARRALARREGVAAERLPYSAQVAPRIARLTDGAYLQTFRLAGASYESADDATVNSWHTRLNVLWRNLASPNVALWVHLVRRRDRRYPRGACAQGFAESLNAAYRARVTGQTLMSNDWYLSVVYRPATTVAGRWTLAALRNRRAVDGREFHLAALEACERLGQTVLAALDVYDPEPLGCVEERGAVRSQLLEFLGFLVNGEHRPVRLPRAPVNEVLATSRLSFGTELLEVRTPTETRWAAMLGIKEYPTPTLPGVFNALLAAPFPLVLTQSFTFLSKAAAQGLMQRQAHRLVNAGDFAVSQSAELSDALDQLTSNEFVMGEHHLSLQVQTEPVSAVIRPAAVLGQLNDDVALARTLLSEAGLTVAREDLALEAAFWAQLPGAFGWRPRKAVISSRNFAAMAPFHAYPGGRPDGNHWGEALALFETRARSPYFFSLHAADPRAADGGAKKDTGHTLICGPTGSGKTVLVGFLVAMLTKHGATQVIFDKDQGLSILVRALGGTYLALETGRPTGCNPLRLDPTPENLEFLKDWLGVLVRHGGREASVRDVAELDQALRAVLALPAEARRLSRLVEFLDPTDPDGLYARLSPWCEVTNGDLAWAFDAAEDRIVGHLASSVLVGIDVTQFLEHARLRTPLTLYLLHLVRQLLDGRRLVCWLDEFWRLVADPAFERFANDGPKTWRKLNGAICFATQSPSDVLGSRISRTLIEQTPTKILLPNPDAATDYVEGFGLTEREFGLIRDSILPGSRQFLVKQGGQSVVCGLDLSGLSTAVAVISGRAHTVELADRLIADVGPDPAEWLPLFDAHVAAGGLKS